MAEMNDEKEVQDVLMAFTVAQAIVLCNMLDGDLITNIIDDMMPRNFVQHINNLALRHNLTMRSMKTCREE